ncbi:MAG: transcriptional regulator [Planctomycetota bacterium]
MAPDETKGAKFSYNGLDRVLHEKARLSILTALSTSSSPRLFPELRALCGLTDGNLNRHLKVLSEAGLVLIDRKDAGPKAKTRVRLSRPGRRAFVAYLEELERVLRDARQTDHHDELGESGVAPA